MKVKVAPPLSDDATVFNNKTTITPAFFALVPENRQFPC